jgi:hypothetical protein
MLTNPKQIHAFRMATLVSGLKLEIRGMSISRGRSCYAILKDELALTGTRPVVLAAAQEILEKLKRDLAPQEEETYRWHTRSNGQPLDTEE